LQVMSRGYAPFWGTTYFLTENPTRPPLLQPSSLRKVLFDNPTLSSNFALALFKKYGPVPSKTYPHRKLYTSPFPPKTWGFQLLMSSWGWAGGGLGGGFWGSFFFLWGSHSKEKHFKLLPSSHRHTDFVKGHSFHWRSFSSAGSPYFLFVRREMYTRSCPSS